mgnify:CR=1 FL=1
MSQTITFTMPAADLRALHANVPVNDVRYYLAGYYLDTDALGNFRLTASDGHAVIRIALDNVEHSGIGDARDFKGCIIPALGKQVPKSAHEVKVVVVKLDEAPGYSIQLSATTKTGKPVALAVTTTSEVDGKYPDIDFALRNLDKCNVENPLPAKFCINYELIARSTRHLNRDPDYPALARMAPTKDGGDPVRVEVQGRDDVLLAVMPARW